MKHAIILTGGKQYRVAEGDVVFVEKLDASAGDSVKFDQVLAAIGGLAKVYDTANVVDSYIPDFMDTIDRLGRILFLFYWKHEDFNSRYGSDDVVQMEDKLRSVFKQLGSLTLDLKNKAVLA